MNLRMKLLENAVFLCVPCVISPVLVCSCVRVLVCYVLCVARAVEPMVVVCCTAVLLSVDGAVDDVYAMCRQRE